MYCNREPSSEKGRQNKSVIYKEIFILVAMSKVIHAEGYDAYKEAANRNNEKTVFVLFSGSIGEDGSSWCPDCVAGRWDRA